MKAKPKKWGIKAFVTSDAVKPYVLNFNIYSGRKLNPELGLSESVVLEHMSRYQLKQHHLYVDNYYTNFNLF